MTLTELAARVEGASGPDRVLDEEIARAIGWTHFFVQNDVWWKSPDGRSLADPPRFTASIDVAMLLVPEGLEWRLEWTRAFNGGGALATVRLSNGVGYNGCASTPALALAAAALRAREALK